jgi:hypothetical protein
MNTGSIWDISSTVSTIANCGALRANIAFPTGRLCRAISAKRTRTGIVGLVGGKWAWREIFNDNELSFRARWRSRAAVGENGTIERALAELSQSLGELWIGPGKNIVVDWECCYYGIVYRSVKNCAVIAAAQRNGSAIADWE